MKIKVKILSLIMTVALLMCYAQPAFAAEKMSDEYWIEGEYIVDAEGNMYSQFCNASGEPVDIEVALDMFNSEVNCDIPRMDTYALVPNFTTVEVTSVNIKYMGAPIKMTQDAVDYTVPAGKTGAVYFRPYYIRAVDQCIESTGQTRAFIAYYPKILDSGYADGLFYLQLS